MSQRKKAKSKKQLKKSVNRLYETLMEEKNRHKVASKMVGELKQKLTRSVDMIQTLAKANCVNIQKARSLERDNDKTLSVAAELLKRSQY